MPSRGDMLEALRKVIDPELGIPITELGMVKFAEAEGETARVQVDVTVEGCPLKDQIQREVTGALHQAGFSKVDLKLGVMTREELEALKKRLGAAKAAQINSQGSSPGGINRLPKKVSSLIAISSGKGGVGKSSVTALLAVALARQGLKIGVLDADITGPSIARIFGVSDRPRVEGGNTLVPVGTRAGVSVLSMNLMIRDEKAPVIWRGPLINSAIRQLYADARWEGHDLLLVDLPPGTSDATLTAFQSLPLDGTVIVSTPQALVGMIVAKSVRMARILHVPILGLVENLAYVQPPGCKDPYYLFGPLRGQETAQEFDIPYLGALPIRPELAEACDQGCIEEMDLPEFRNIAKRIWESQVAKRSTQIAVSRSEA